MFRGTVSVQSPRKLLTAASSLIKMVACECAAEHAYVHRQDSVSGSERFTENPTHLLAVLAVVTYSCTNIYN